MFRKLVQENPGDSMVHYNLGTAFRQQGQLEEAAAAFEDALYLDPNLADARADLGACLGQMGRWPEAIASLEEACRLDPTSAEFRLNLALAYLGAGRIRDAAESLAFVTEQHLHDAGARFLLGSCLARLGDADGARKQVEALQGLDPHLAAKLEARLAR